ncbi:MAG TPA: AAA family ATPase [Thermodesulfobacteriota bacterium]|nr:AAA family ATPase [Thermodesulfobacteriota bacterium]
MSNKKGNPNGGGTFGFQQDLDVMDILAQNSCNENYQRNVIGNILNDNKMIDELNLDAVVFDARHSTIYYAILTLKRQDKPSDVLTVSEELENNGELEKIGGLTYLDTLSSQAICANVKYHAEKLKESSQLKSLALKSHALMKAIKNKASRETINKLKRNISESTIACHDNSLKPISANELKDCEPVPTLWGEIFYPGCITQINSEPGVGKTTLLYNICACGAMGKNFLDIPFSKKIKTLYCDLETIYWLRRAKLERILASKDLPENFHFLDTLDFVRDNQDLLALCRKEKYDLVIFDTQSRVLATEKENDNSEANKMLDLMRRLTIEMECALGLVHHAGKGENSKSVYKGRGASAIAGGVDIIVNLESLDEEIIKLTIGKNRIVGTNPVLYLRKVGEDIFETYSPEGESSGFEIFNVQDFINSLSDEREWTTGEIYELGKNKNFSESTLKRALSRLVEARKWERVKKGMYRKKGTGHGSKSSGYIPDPIDPLTRNDEKGLDPWEVES